jgi:hypothetical protein
LKRCIVIRETDIEDPTSLRSADAGEVTGTGSHTAEEVLALVDEAMLGEEHVAVRNLGNFRYILIPKLNV